MSSGCRTESHRGFLQSRLWNREPGSMEIAHVEIRGRFRIWETVCSVLNGG